MIISRYTVFHVVVEPSWWETVPFQGFVQMVVTKGMDNIGVATNNSYECVHEFLNLYCGGINIPIVGRIGSCPELMKPNRWPLVEALKKMNCRVDNSLFLGDTLRDYECAKNACCKFIGVAPTERKLKRLKTIKPEIDIVSDFYELNKKILT